MARLLAAAGDGDAAAVPPASSSPVRRTRPEASDVVQVRHRQYLVEEVIPPGGPDEASRVVLSGLDDDNQGRRLEASGRSSWVPASFSPSSTAPTPADSSIRRAPSTPRTPVLPTPRPEAVEVGLAVGCGQLASQEGREPKSGKLHRGALTQTA